MSQNRIRQLIQRNLDAKGRAFKAAVQNDVAEVYLYDVIDPYFGISAESFVKALKDIKAKTVHLHVNSPGGDVFEARAMATAIKAFPGEVKAFIDGLAASAATYVAMSAASVEMSKGSFLMIHNAWTIAMGNADDLMETAALLEKIDGTIVDDYVAKTGLPPDEVAAMMAAETWMTADEALAAKFVDSVSGSESKQDRIEWDLSAYSNCPQTVTVEATALHASDEVLARLPELVRNATNDALRAIADEENAKKHAEAVHKLNCLALDPA